MLIDSIVLQAVTIQGKHSQQETNGYNIKKEKKQKGEKEYYLSLIF